MAGVRFGKRSIAAPQPAMPRPVQLLDSVQRQPSRIPFLSLAVFVVLACVFAQETSLGTEAGLTIPHHSLIAFGGVSGQLVFGDGQWWRIFTAPLLHGSLQHLLSNAFALLLAGFMLEPLIGRAWFGAIFAIGAVAGSIGSLMMNPPFVVSVGASGAIMALLAAVIVCSFHYGVETKGRRLRTISLWLLVPALLPLATGIDYGAHTGGTIAGGALGFVLQIVWPETDPRPAHTAIARNIALAGAAAAAIALLLVAVMPTPDVGQSIKLIPDAQLPAGADDGMAKSRELVRLYPDDPRGHFLHALALLKLRQLTDAQAELRIALAKSADPRITPEFRTSARVLLALTMGVQHREDDARNILASGDCAFAASHQAMFDAHVELQKRGICP